MFFFPFGVDVAMGRLPFANWALIALNFFVFLMQLQGKIGEDAVMQVADGGWNPLAMLASCFLHGSVGHVLGNMLFLWTFGNPICAALGTWRYLLVYAALGIFSSATMMVAHGEIGIGASGAINGIVGMYLVLFPVNDVSCFWYFFYRWGVVEVSGFWLVLLWLSFDILGVIRGQDDGVGYWAHLGGVAGGIGLGFLFDVMRWTLLEPDERCSILALATERNQDQAPPGRERGQTGARTTAGQSQTSPIRRPPPKPVDDSPIPMD